MLSLAQEAAERSRLLYKITDAIRRATSIRSIMKITADELARILDAKRATIEITVDPIASQARDHVSGERMQ